MREIVSADKFDWNDSLSIVLRHQEKRGVHCTGRPYFTELTNRLRWSLPRTDRCKGTWLDFSSYSPGFSLLSTSTGQLRPLDLAHGREIVHLYCTRRPWRRNGTGGACRLNSNDRQAEARQYLLVSISVLHRANALRRADPYGPFHLPSRLLAIREAFDCNREQGSEQALGAVRQHSL